MRWFRRTFSSTVLGLAGTGPVAFNTYLRNRGMELNYNLLYEQKGNFDIERTLNPLAGPPIFPDRSLAVFSHFLIDGRINNYPEVGGSDPAGARFFHGANDILTDDVGGKFWIVPSYDATGNQLVIQYTAQDLPASLVLELKNSADEIVYEQELTLVVSDGSELMQLVIDLPDAPVLPGDPDLSDIRVIALVVDQRGSADNSADFHINTINFQHFSE